MADVEEAAKLKEEIAFLSSLIDKHKGGNHGPKPTTAFCSTQAPPRHTRKWVAPSFTGPNTTSQRCIKNDPYNFRRAQTYPTAAGSKFNNPRDVTAYMKDTGNLSGREHVASQQKVSYVNKVLHPSKTKISSEKSIDNSAKPTSELNTSLITTKKIILPSKLSSKSELHSKDLVPKVTGVKGENRKQETIGAFKKRTVLLPSSLGKGQPNPTPKLVSVAKSQQTVGLSSNLAKLKEDNPPDKICSRNIKMASREVVIPSKDKIPTNSAVSGPSIAGLKAQGRLISASDSKGAAAQVTLHKTNSGTVSHLNVPSGEIMIGPRCQSQFVSKPYRSVRTQSAPQIPKHETTIEAGKRIVEEIEKLKKAMAAIEKAEGTGKPKQDLVLPSKGKGADKSVVKSKTNPSNDSIHGSTKQGCQTMKNTRGETSKSSISPQGYIVRKTKYSINKITSVRKELQVTPKTYLSSSVGNVAIKGPQSKSKSRPAVIASVSAIHKASKFTHTPAVTTKSSQYRYVRQGSWLPSERTTTHHRVARSPLHSGMGRKLMLGRHKLLRTSIFSVNHSRSPSSGRKSTPTLSHRGAQKIQQTLKVPQQCSPKKQMLKDLLTDVAVKTAKIKHSQRVLRRALLFRQPKKKIVSSKLRPRGDTSRLKWRRWTEENRRNSNNFKQRSEMALKQTGIDGKEWKSRFSLRRHNSEQPLSINRLLGRTVNNLSSNRYKFISGTARGKAPIPRHVLERSLRQMPRQLKKGRPNRLQVDHRHPFTKGSRSGERPKQVSSSGRLVQIGGILYKSSQRNLRRTNIPAQTAKVIKKPPSGMITIRNMSSPRMKMVKVQGVKYRVDNRGRTLQRVLTDSPEVTRYSGYLKRVDLGGVTYMQTKPGTLVRATTSSVRATASRSIQRSIVTAARLKKVNKKRQYCMFYNRFGKCNRTPQCPYIHDPDKVAVCTRFLRGTCKITSCPFSHQVAPEKMPVCTHFLRGVCTRDPCPYLHVNVSKDAAICNDFLKGYCPLGDKCKKKHSRVCPDHDGAGSCPRKAACRLHHPKANKRRRSSSSSSKKSIKRKRTVTRVEEVDDRDLPLRDRHLPSFISLESAESVVTTVDQSDVATSPVVQEPLQIFPDLSFDPESSSTKSS